MEVKGLTLPNAMHSLHAFDWAIHSKRPFRKWRTFNPYRILLVAIYKFPIVHCSIRGFIYFESMQ